jgi:hypothetical protein
VNRARLGHIEAPGPKQVPVPAVQVTSSFVCLKGKQALSLCRLWFQVCVSLFVALS